MLLLTMNTTTPTRREVELRHDDCDGAGCADCEGGVLVESVFPHELTPQEQLEALACATRAGWQRLAARGCVADLEPFVALGLWADSYLVTALDADALAQVLWGCRVAEQICREIGGARLAEAYETAALLVRELGQELPAVTCTRCGKVQRVDLDETRVPSCGWCRGGAVVLASAGRRAA